MGSNVRVVYLHGVWVWAALLKSQNIKHPPALIPNSNALCNQLIFNGLLLLTMTFVGQTASLLLKVEINREKAS